MGEAFVSLRNCQGAWLGPALILGVDVNKIVQILLYVECLRSSSLKNIPFKNINMKINSLPTSYGFPSLVKPVMKT